ncbi:YqcC family protein [Vibrio rhizosphaerae]|uniref:YqcC family protein n=1 Tax=Vibrio rhizosphaerae TaxID=398736 RepID=A0ABU4ISB5_9VIBR|nr:YqcC family protein [Vibrio rhizosphaerae]MDW6092274.1 YqcC family protein [Vibrio rhizosphaerae]
MSKYYQLNQSFNELEACLKMRQLWQDTPPSAQALSSQQPFAVDTLLPEQWLQWVFIPQMRQRIATAASVPSGFEMTPYFIEAWRDNPNYQPVIRILMKIEAHCRDA